MRERAARRCGRRACGVAVGALTLSLLAAGCSADGQPRATPSAPATFTTVVDTVLQGDVSPETRTFLEALKPKGEMTFEDYRQGKALYQSCVKSLGISVTYYETNAEGSKSFFSTESVIPGSNVNPDDIPTLEKACASSIDTPIDEVYLQQPTSIARKNAYFEKFRPALTDCLKKAGLSVPKDATYDEVMQQIIVASDHNVECLLETGYYPKQAVPGAGG